LRRARSRPRPPTAAATFSGAPSEPPARRRPDCRPSRRGAKRFAASCRPAGSAQAGGARATPKPWALPRESLLRGQTASEQSGPLATTWPKRRPGDEMATERPTLSERFLLPCLSLLQTKASAALVRGRPLARALHRAMLSLMTSSSRRQAPHLGAHKVAAHRAQLFGRQFFRRRRRLRRSRSARDWPGQNYSNCLQFVHWPRRAAGARFE
jgi:hypothetical protein